MKKIILSIIVLFILNSCGEKISPKDIDATMPLIKPSVITEQTPNDTDDPAIWIHPTDATKSLIIGTDKKTGGGLYIYNLEGKIINKYIDMKRPNNVDIAYGLNINGVKTDIAVATERKANKIRIFSLPDLKPIDNGGIDIFEGEQGKGERDGMGIALYTKPIDTLSTEIYAIVGRKTGPSGTYLWQYKLSGKPDGMVTAEVVRKFGKFSNKKEIEAIAVDNELGYVYYSDEQSGVRKYYADPEKGNEELAYFARKDAKRDHEGIAIYKKNATEGYILVSNQQNGSILVYPREGSPSNANQHQLITDIPFSAVECDGIEVSNLNFGTKFPNGILIAMSDNRTFQFYDWRLFQEKIDAQAKK